MIKLGGSVLTDKEKKYTFNTRLAKRLLKEIKNSSIEDFIIIHGGGSFGHPGADKYGLNEKNPEVKPEGISKVQLDMRRMNNRVLEIMQKIGLYGVSIPGGLITLFEDGNLVELDREMIQRYMSLGVVPVAFGDVTIDKNRGLTICSGDDIVLGLSDLAEKAIFVTDVDGIYKKGELVESFTEEMYPLEKNDVPEKKEKIDVTGGMNKKVEKMLKISESCETYVVNGKESDRVYDLLEGKDIRCTEVKG